MKSLLLFILVFFTTRSFAVCTVGSATGLVNVVGSILSTGSAPFDADPADPACSNGSTLHTEGQDCGANNRVVRIGQQTVYPVTVTTTGDSDTNIRLTLVLTNGTWASLPPVCLAGSSGTNTATLVCNLGTGSAILGGGTGIGSGVINFTANNNTNSRRTQQQTMTVSAQSTCHAAGAGVTIVSPANIEISARLAQPELTKLSWSSLYAPNGSYAVNAGVVGRNFLYISQIFDKGNGLFVETPLSSSLVFQDILTPFGIPYKLVGTGFLDTSATQSGGSGSPITMTQNSYLLSRSIPFTGWNGTPPPAGANYNVGTYKYGGLYIFIPESYIAANCPLSMTNTFSAFDPKDQAGASLGTDDVSNNSVVNNIGCTTPVAPAPGGGFMYITPQRTNYTGNAGSISLGASDVNFNAGAIPAGVFAGTDYEYNWGIATGMSPTPIPQVFTNHIYCLSNMTPQLHWFEEYIGTGQAVKIAHQDWSLSNVDSYTYNTPDRATYDPYSFEIEYGIQGTGASIPSNGTCDDSDATWYSLPSLVPGGVKNANKVRIKIPSLTCRINPNLAIDSGVQCRTAYSTHMRVSASATAGGITASGSLPAGDRPYVSFSVKTNGIWKNATGGNGVPSSPLKSYSTIAGAPIPPAPTNTAGAGNYVLVKNAVARVTKSVAANFGTPCSSSGAAAPCDVLTGPDYTFDYNLQPSFTGPAAPSLQDNLTVTDILPNGVIYVDGSSKVGGVTTAPNQITSNPDGSTTLKWILANRLTNAALPAITFKAYVDPTYSNGIVFTNKANIYSKYDPQSGTSDTEVYANVRTLVIGGFSVQKVASPLAQEISLATNIDFDLRYSNTTTASNLAGGVDLIDILPYNGDGRSPPSNFTGTLKLRAFPTNSGDASMLFYYTSRVPALISQTTEQYTAPSAPNWCTQAEFGMFGCPASLADVTAIRAKTSVTLTPGYIGQVDMPTVAVGASPGNIFSNVFTARQPSIHLDPSFILPTGNVKSSVVRLSTISGTVFIDENLNNLMDVTPTDTRISGVTITLSGITSTGTPFSLTTTTNALGNYTFTDVPSGTYTVTQTQPTGLVEGINQVGSAGGSPSSTTTTSVIASIVLPMSTDAVGYNFGEQRKTSISKVFNPSTILNGGTSTVTLTITNPFLIALPGARFTDALPANMTTIASSQIVGGTCTGASTNTIAASSTIVNITGLTLAAGTVSAPSTCTITFTITSSVDGAYINRTTGVTTHAGAVTGTPSNDAPLSVGSQPDLSIVKSASPAIWYHGWIGSGGVGPLYTISVTNSGTSATNSVIEVKDTLPLGIQVNGGAAGVLTLQSSTGNWACSSDAGSPQIITCSTSDVLSNIAGSNTFSFGFHVQVLGTAISPLINTARITRAGGDPSLPPVATATTTLLPVPSITKSFNPTTFVLSASAQSLMTLTLTNPHTTALTNASFTDTFVTHLKTIASSQVASGSCVGASSNTIAASSTSLNISGLTIPAGVGLSPGTCTITLRVTADDVGSFDNITSGVTGNYGVTSVTGAPSNIANLLVTGFSQIGIAKKFVQVIPNIDGTYDMQLKFSAKNTGTFDLSNIQIKDDLSAVFSNASSWIIHSMTDTGSTLTGDGSLVGSNTTGELSLLSGVDTLLINESKVFFMTVRIKPGLTIETYNNQATITGTTPSSTTISDLSTNGENIDLGGDSVGLDGDGDPTNTDSKTPLTYPRIAISKKITSIPIRNADGTFSVNFELQVKNTGTQDLTGVSVKDTLEGAFPLFGTYNSNALSLSEYKIETLPSVSGTGLLVANMGYSGESGLNELASGSLLIGASNAITFTIRVYPISNLASPYLNSAQATTSIANVLDTSNDGNFFEDGAGDGHANELIDNTPTPVSFDLPILSTLKNVGTPLRVLSLGTDVWDVPYTVRVKNIGSRTAYDVALIDDLLLTYPAPVTFEVLAGASATNITLNPLFVGSTNSLPISVLAQNGELDVNEEAYINFTVRIKLNGSSLTTFLNQVNASATNYVGGPVTTTDSSDYSDIHDPNSNGNPSESGENDPTPVSFNTPVIGVSKKVVSVTTNAGVSTIIYETVIKNFSTTHKAYNVQAVDNLALTFTGASVDSASVTSVSGPLTINPSFNGTSDTNLLTGADTLNEGQVATLRITANISGASGRYDNSILVSAATSSGGATSTTDVSMDGDLSDPNGDHNPSGIGEDVPTPVILESALLGSTKRVLNLVSTGTDTYQITYEIAVKNLSTNYTAYNVLLKDDLSQTFSAPASFVIDSVLVLSGPLVVNPSYTGFGANTDLVNGLIALSPNAEAKLELRVSINTSLTPQRVFNNQVLASANVTSDPLSALITDLSNDGTLYDSNSNNNPNEVIDNNPTPVNLVSGADLISSKKVSGSFTVGNTFSDYTYTLSTKNQGLGATTGSYTLTDTLHAGLMITQIEAGDFTCSTVGQTISCVSSRVLAPNEESSPVIVHVRPTQTMLPSGVTSINIQNTLNVSGGGEDPGVTNNNSDTITHTILSGASVSGNVFRDADGDGNREGGPGVANFFVQLIDPNTGEILSQTMTDASGHYKFSGLTPNTPYEIVFRDNNDGVPGNVIFGTPVSKETGNAGNKVTRPVGVTESIVAGGSTLGTSTIKTDRSRLIVNLSPDEELINQSLPLDPAGVIYDSITRAPVPGSKISLKVPAGCPYNLNTDLFNASSYVINASGTSATMTVGTSGMYQFLLSQAPGVSCNFILEVTPPSGYTAPSSIIPVTPGASPTPNGAGVYNVQTNSLPPTGNQPTTYYLIVKAGFGSFEVLNNNIPLDPIVAASLGISKVVDNSQAEIGDSVKYTITVRNPNLSPAQNVTVHDRLPFGFKYINGTATVKPSNVATATKLNDPLSVNDSDLEFMIGSVPANGNTIITYRVRIGIGAQTGENINIATASNALTSTPLPAQAIVRVRRGVFMDEACVEGKVYVDCNENHVQDFEEIGIAGVRIYTENGTYFVTDSEGKYSYCGLRPITHVFKVDNLTMPIGSRLVPITNRHAGVGGSQFVDLKFGELHRADFAEGSCSMTVLDQVRARANLGEVNTAYEEKLGRVQLSNDKERNCNVRTSERDDYLDKMMIFDSNKDTLAPLRADPCSHDSTNCKDCKKAKDKK